MYYYYYTTWARLGSVDLPMDLPQTYPAGILRNPNCTAGTVSQYSQFGFRSIRADVRRHVTVAARRSRSAKSIVLSRLIIYHSDHAAKLELVGGDALALALALAVHRVEATPRARAPR